MEDEDSGCGVGRVASVRLGNGEVGDVLRSWNMHIFGKDQGAARRMPEMAAGEDRGGSESTRSLLFVESVSLFKTFTMV